jgi:hypothetical protein
MKHGYKSIFTLAISLSAIALGAQPAIEWGARYNSPPDMADNAMDIAVDAAGNVYVTGSVFNSAGNLDGCTIKYDANGNQMWVRNFDRGVGDNDICRSIALDAAGNVFVTGFSRGGSSSNDVLTVKYDNAGTQQWASFYNGPYNGVDEGNSIAVDANSNVYVCGFTPDSAAGKDALTVCYNSAGTQQWAQVYDGPASGNDELLDIVLDGSANVYVTGNAAQGPFNWDILTIKYSSAGSQLWLDAHGSPTDGDYGKAITLDMNGNVLVGAQSGLAPNNWFDYLAVKYTSAGVFQWDARYNNGNNKYEDLWEICADNAGYVYVTGQSQSTAAGANPDCATVKYTPSGNQVWVQRYDGGFNNSDDRAYAMVLDDTANVYVAGYSRNASNLDFITIKYDSSGTQEFVLRYNSQYNQLDQINAIAVQNGNIYVTGTSANAANEDFMTIKYSYAAVGVNEVGSSNQPINAFPNPTSDVLNLSFMDSVEPNSQVILQDLSGRTVMMYNVASLMISRQINISELASGTYLLSQIGSDGTVRSTQRIIKN